MKLLTSLILLVCMTTSAFSQTTPSWAWGNNVHAVGTVIYHDDHLYTSTSDNTVVKWDTLGNELWEYPITNTNNSSIVHLRVDGNNDIIVSGVFSGSVSIGTFTFNSAGLNDIFVCKMDQAGTILWANQYGTTADDYTSKFCVDASNHIYTNENTKLRRLDASGNTVWTKNFNQQIIEILYSAPGSKLYVTGSFTGTMNLNGNTITAGYSASYGVSNDYYVAEIGTDSSFIGLVNLSYSVRNDSQLQSYVNETTGAYFFAYRTIILAGSVFHSTCDIYASSFSFWPPSPGYDNIELKSISGHDSLVSIAITLIKPGGFANPMIVIVNTVTQQVSQILTFYSNAKSYAFRRKDAIYIGGAPMTPDWGYYLTGYSFGKLGPGNLFAAPSTVAMNSCPGQEVTMIGNISGGQTPYTYSWSPTAGLTYMNNDTAKFMPTSTTSYTLTVTDANGAIARDTFQIYYNVPLSPVVLSSSAPNFCHDSLLLTTNLTAGSGVFTVWKKYNPTLGLYITLGTGGNSRYIYQSGTYSVLVSNSCGTVADTIVVPPAFMLGPVVSSGSNPTCAGNTISINGHATAPVSYSWSGGVTNLVPFVPAVTQTYTVVATDSNACVNIDSIKIEVLPLPNITATTASPSSSCGTGNSILSVSSSIPFCTPVLGSSYAGMNGVYIQVFNFNSGAINHLTGDGPGDYNDYSNIQANVIAGNTYPFSIIPNSAGSVASANRIWADFNQNGIFTDPGELVFNQSFASSPVTGSIAIPLNAMNGFVRLRIDAGGGSPCKQNAFGEYEDYGLIVTGGVNGINWSPSTFLSSATGTPVTASNVNSTTTYTVTVTNGSNCSSSSSVTMTINQFPSVTANASLNPICIGQAETLTGSGANTYTWTGGVINNAAFIPSSTQTYTVTGTDANNCSNTSSVTVNVNALPSVTAISSSSTICLNDLVILNGNGANAYSWTGGITNNTAFNPSSTQTYTVTGIDANNCSNTSSVTVNVNALPLVTANSSSPSVCLNDPVTLNGGGAIMYSWTGGVINNASFIPSSTQTYTVTGTDANNCSNTSSVTVNVNALPSVTAISSSPTVCLNDQVTLNGNGASTYSWTGGVVNNVAFNPSSTQTYTVTGTDANNCSNTSSVTVNLNPLPIVTATSTNNAICFSNNVVLNGGGASVYTWSGGVIDNTPFAPTFTQTYTVTGSDANNCSNTSSVMVVVYPLPVISATASDSTICLNEIITLNGNGASTYVWTGGVVNNMPFSPSSTQTYTVTGTDANNCSNSSSLQIVVNSLPTITATTSGSIICANDSVTLNGSGGQNYLWTGGVIDNIPFSPLVTQTYTVTGTDANNCSNTSSIHIVVNALPIVTALASSPTVCYNSPLTLNGAGALTYTWTGGVVNNIPFNALLTQAYIVTGTDANNCSNTSMITVVVNSLPVISATASSTAVCENDSVTLNGVGAAFYTWSGGVNNNTAFVPGGTTTYTVTGTDANNCSNTSSISITVYPLPMPVIVQSGSTLTCSNTSNCTYSWELDGTYVDTTKVINISQNGTYIVSATDSSGCTGYDTLKVTGIFTNDLNASLFHFSMYPNPSSGYLVLNYTLPADDQVSIRLLDATGRMLSYVAETQIQKKGTHTMTLNLSEFNVQGGMYLIQFETSKGNVLKKLIYR